MLVKPLVVRSPSAIREHRGRVVAACVLTLGILVAVIAFWPRTGTRGFTGVAVMVPSCPAGAEGCRVFVTRASDGSPAAREDWSGTATTLNMVLPAGRYGVAAEGCTGDSIEMSVVTVISGFHTALDLGVYWEMPRFLGRACPGFIPAASG
jgi:hypothetical protein